MDSIKRYLYEIQKVLDILPYQRISDVIDVLLAANHMGSMIFVMGNGGSAATASHFACDLSKGTVIPGRPRFRVIALTDNVPIMTAWSDDVSYDDLFAEQLRGLISRGDVVIGISDSGNSTNVLKAIQVARDMGGITIGLSGFSGGQLSTLVDIPLIVPSNCMEQIGDVHMVLCHLICTALREQLKEIEPPLTLIFNPLVQQRSY